MFWRSYTALIFSIVLSAGFAFGQDPTPSPTPEVEDKQKVATERLQGVPAIAPNYRSDERGLPDLGRVGVDMLDQRSLTLSDAIRLALENNNDIEVTRQNVKIAEFDLKAVRGYYQTRFTGQTYYENATVPNISFFSPESTSVQSSNFVGNMGVRAYIPRFGTIFDVTANNSRVGTDNLVAIISPQYNANITASVVQPIFRGRSFDQPRRAIEIAKRNLSLTDVQFRQRTIETIVNVQRAYWDLAFSLRNLQVQRDGVKDAKDQFEHNKRLVEEGQLAPIDIVASETQVANFEQAVYEALNGVNQAENNLKNLIAPNKNAKIWRESLTPTDPVDLSSPNITLGEALDAAMSNRPELELNQVQRDINQIDRQFYADQKKPQIDLVASYTAAGVGGSLNPNFTSPFCRDNPNPEQCIGPVQALLQNVGGGGSALSDVFSNKYPTVRVGVQFNIPLFGDKTAGAQYGRSLVEGEKIETQREQLEQSIQVDVRNAIQAVRTSEARLRAAAIARENTVKQYESEQRKLDSGQSDIYKVLERQTALTLARSSELRSQTDLNKAIADLQRATGNSLKANNVVSMLKK